MRSRADADGPLPISGPFVFTNSADEVTMSVGVASAATRMLPVTVHNHFAPTIDPLPASLSAALSGKT